MSLVVALAVGVGLLFLVTALARPRRSGRPLRARSRRFLARYRVGEDRAPGAAVVVGAVAAATVADLGGTVLLAPVLGALVAMLRRPERALDAIGAVGAAVLLVAAIGDPCPGVLGATTAVLAVAGFGVGYLVGRVLGRRGPGPGAALFGVLDLARFAASPLGAAWSGDSASSVVLVVLAVATTGVLVGIAPRLSLALVAVGIAYVEIVGPPLLGVGECGSPSPTRLVVIALFTAAYAGVRAVRSC